MIMLRCYYFVHQMTCCLFGELDFGSDIHKHWHSVSVQFSILKHVIKTICVSSVSNLNIMSKSGLFTLFPAPPVFDKMSKSGHWSVHVSKFRYHSCFPNLKFEWTIQPYHRSLNLQVFFTSASGADAQQLSNKTKLSSCWRAMKGVRLS
jgi:hypothetical protein